MKKIGILTFYYEGENYGAALQSFALWKAFDSLGANAEQIKYMEGADESLALIRKVYRAMKRLLKPKKVDNDLEFKNNLQLRARTFQTFRESIPHSKKIYNRVNAKKLNDEYDLFVAGSDQIWNPASEEPFFLTFVKDKPKYSYAASLGTNELSETQKEVFKQRLKDFEGITVREKDSVELLKSFLDNDVQLVADPTLLLSKEEWSDFAKEKETDGKYLFCYFLGGDTEYRKLAERFAQEHKLKIITLPNMQGKKRECDKDFGDIRLYDLSPEEFVYLIKNAEYVFTDSFHGCVFSNIFEKEFFVFPRSKFVRMSGRIVNLCSSFQTIERFCCSEDMQTPEYISSLAKPEFNNQASLELKNISLKYIERIANVSKRES